MARRTKMRTASTLFALLTVALVAFGCSSGTPSASSATGASSGAAAETTTTVTPSQAAVLRRLATDGDHAAFERRLFGSIAAAPGSPTEGGTLIALGIAGNVAVAYVCDGSVGTWFVGDASSGGAMKLRALGGDGTLELPSLPPTTEGAASGALARVALAGQQAIETTLDLAREGDRWVRVESAASSDGAPGTTAPATAPATTAASVPGSIELVGGVIIRESSLKGAATIKLPSGSSVSVTSLSTTTSTAASASAPRLSNQIVSAAGPTRLTIDLTQTLEKRAACQARIDALQTLIGSLESVRDEYNRQIAELTAQAEQFERLAAATPPIPELLGQKQSYEAQARAFRDRIRGVAMALTNVQLQLATLRAELVDLQHGGC